ncbi:MAG: hypothetical protein BM555_01450 [Crocinitomix sp. MedPE-SWsnd]|nr:MAG: hypothetical protein BM555_01450 [Crocinitomix sp. MedPE-SWsnd]
MSKSEYIIRFSGLKEGVYNYGFEVGNAFFEQLDYSEIEKAQLKVKAVFEKKETMLMLNIELEGEVELMCDKCTDDFNLLVSGEEELIYKFGEGESDDEKIIIISHNEIEIDISQPIYEVTCLAIPSKRVHPEGQCNEEMLNAMDNYLMVESDEVDDSADDDSDDNDEVDPRWAALNKLK